MPSIKHKFAMGQTVWWAYRGNRQVKNECPDCIGIDEDKFTCKKCYGNKLIYSWEEGAWNVAGPFTIGAVRIDWDSAYRGRPAKHEIKYMMHETGVGSGALYDESTLYSTREAAVRAGKKKENE